MQIFQLVCGFFQTMGIYLREPNQVFSFNFNNILISSSIAVNFISVTAFFLFEAKSIDEYGLSFYGSTTGLAVFIVFHINIFHMGKIIRTFEIFEKLIEKSNYYCNEWTWDFDCMEKCVFIEFFLIFVQRNAQFKGKGNIHRCNRGNWTNVQTSSLYSG